VLTIASILRVNESPQGFRNALDAKIGEMQVPIMFVITAALVLAQEHEAQQPKETWQKPGSIQQPKGPWQKPGEIQVPKGIQAIRSQVDQCQRRFIVGSDALFEFDKSTLTTEAKETLNVLGPMIQKAGEHPVVLEGHTDALGKDAYNWDLSERRAGTVRNWLIERGFLKASLSQVQGFGKTRPAAPNTGPDGADNPAGRQKNRRVEVVIDTCK
jgi:outer membrane protein OmpA-like peptidoglycan-associated protein